MIISDLNVLEAVEGSAIVGGTLPPTGLVFTKNLLANVVTNNALTANYNVTDIFNKKALIDVKSNVKGNSSDFTFDNEAIGPNSTTEGTFNQQVIAGVGSSQNGSFVAAANK